MLGRDVLLFPSRGEGLGTAAVEGKEVGLPVLVSAAVPRDRVVVSELVRFQKVEAGAALWASELLQLVAHRPEISDANRRVGVSAFSIDSSACALLRL